MRARQRSDIASEIELSIHEALRIYIEQDPLPFAVTRGAAHTLTYANAAFCQMAHVTSGVALGEPISAFIGTHGSALSEILDRAFHGTVELTDQPLAAGSDSGIGWRCSVWPVIAENGETEALGIQIREPSPPDSAVELQRQIAEQMLLTALRERGIAEDAEAARRRAVFLAETGRLLAGSVDQASTLAALARLALPALDAWCFVDVLGDGDAIRRLSIYHPDPAKLKLASTLDGVWTPTLNEPFGAAAMLREPRTVVIAENIESALAAGAPDANMLRVLDDIGIGSLVTVPLIARKKLLGAITFVSSPDAPAYGPADVQLAEEVANLAALALDNAQVYDLALALRRSAETANKAKSAFLGAMSHELRTPLNAIGGYIDLLDMGLRGPVTAEQRSDFARVKANQRHLAVLITEILNFVRVGSGTVSYLVGDVWALDALKHAVELVEPLFMQKGVVFDGVSGDANLVARADADRVTQILVNLLSNAIKFTAAGGHVSAECAAADNVVALRVSDTGIGIPADKHEAIFEPFMQLKDGFAGRESGIGLGLAISRDLARAMQGDLTVRSTVGKGSIFTLALPRGNEGAGATDASGAAIPSRRARLPSPPPDPDSR